MSNLAISNALESRLNDLTPALATAWENVEFTPVLDVAYQQAFVLFAEPENPTFGDGFYRQRGYLQVSLMFPLNVGKEDVFNRAELIRQHFERGLSLTVDGVTTIIEKTPEVSNGQNQGDRYVVTVKIRFFANIFD